MLNKYITYFTSDDAKIYPTENVNSCLSIQTVKLYFKLNKYITYFSSDDAKIYFYITP